MAPSRTETLAGSPVDTDPGASLSDRLAAAVSNVGLPHLLLLALVLRLAAFAVATPAHPDEVFQYLETAHRLVFGHGVITWEWRHGMRGWLLPLLVSGPMALGGWLDPQGGLYLALPKLVMVAASLVTVVVAWKLGARVSRLHAQVAGFVAAIWYEFVYFAPHVMSETAAIALILPAALLLMDKPRRSFWRLAAAAALLACAAALRFQYLAAIGALVTACCIADLKRCWAPLLVGGVAGLAPSVICDLAMGAVPFAWLVENIRLNFVENRAAGFSSSGPLGYAVEAWPHLALWAVPLLVLAAVGARRYPALAWMAAANLVFHSAIAHKEYRFIFLSVLAAVLLAAIGTVDWVLSVERRDGGAAGRSKLQFLIMVWVIASLSCGFGGFRSQWMKFHPEMDLYARLRGDPALCGLAIYRHDYSVTGGYAYLHRVTPMFYFTDEDSRRPVADLAAAAGAFNVILATPALAAELPAAFKPVACENAGSGSACLFRRPGRCLDAGSPFAINAVLARLEQ
jgi:phosphatidylinositol glycan class B